jgi:hypothetical protein
LQSKAGRSADSTARSSYQRDFILGHHITFEEWLPRVQHSVATATEKQGSRMCLPEQVRHYRILNRFY